MEKENCFHNQEDQFEDSTYDGSFSQGYERTEQVHDVGKVIQESQEEIEEKMEKGQKDSQKEVEGCSQEGKEGIQASAQNAEADEQEDQKGEQAYEKENSQNDQADSEELLIEPFVPEQYSCSYGPPAYTPNFETTCRSQEEDRRVYEKKAHTSMKGLWFSMALTAAVAVVIGALFGIYFSDLFGDGKMGGLYRPAATITKNNGTIEVNEIIGSTGYKNLTVEEVAAYASESVVEITTAQGQFRNSVSVKAGSGVIITENGYIITNHHVVDGATTVAVRLTSGDIFEAEMIGSDANSDIAVLRVSATGLKAATLGKSSDLKVGQGVVAIGNPLGTLGGTVTDGIISAKDRMVNVEGYPMTLLQTNAAINQGNSGGGLFNMAGELIGIVNSKNASAGIEGLGFAIPIDIAWQKASDLMQYGYVTGEPLLEFIAEAINGQMYITSSENAELKKDDRIVSINDQEIHDVVDYRNALYTLKKGDTLKLVVSRSEGIGIFSKPREYTVTMTVRVTEPNH